MPRGESSNQKQPDADGPFSLWADDPLALIPHEQVKAALTEWFAEDHRAEWDNHSPDYGQEFFLSREAGLRAYAGYESDFYLRTLYHHDREEEREFPEQWRIDQFGECMFLEAINRQKEDALANMHFSWLFDAKRKRKDKRFFVRLGQWLEREKERPTPNVAIKRYAVEYDRFMIPFEFATDEFAAQVMTYVDQRNENDIDVDHSSDKTRKWRTNYLRLPLTKPVAGKWSRKKQEAHYIGESCRQHQIPLPSGLPEVK